MPVPTGTYSPWRELEIGDGTIYLRDGFTPGAFDYLAETLRVNGVASSLGEALKAAESSTLSLGWYGYLDDGTETLCDNAGETEDGEYVDFPHECVIAQTEFCS